MWAAKIVLLVIDFLFKDIKRRNNLKKRYIEFVRRHNSGRVPDSARLHAEHLELLKRQKEND